MRLRRALGALLLVAVATGVTLSAPAPPAGAALPSVLMVGDSTMRGMSTTAQAVIRAGYDLTFDSGSCRRLIAISCKPIPNALSVIQANPYRDAVVIMTGYNDWKVGDAVDVIMAEAARQGIQYVIWLTYRTDIAEGAQKPIAISAVFRDHNVELAQKAPLYPGLHVLDWDGYSAGRDDWFAWDGFHLANPGGFALAGYLKATLDGLNLARCRPSSAAGTPTAPPSDVAASVAPPVSLGLSAAQRLVDTRVGPPLGPGRSFAVALGGLAPPGTTSALVNLGAVGPCASGFLTAYPCGAVPLASNVNFSRATTVANLASVRLDANGTFCVYSSAQTDVLVDLLGLFNPVGLLFNPMTPERFIDTRAGGGALVRLVGPLSAGVALAVPVRGTGSVPSDAGAVALNVTVVGPSAGGFLTVFPCGPLPATSNLNFAFGRVVANLAVVPIAANGTVCVQSSAATHLLVDVVGWFGADGLRFRAATPRRLVDTRAGRGAPAGVVGARETLSFDLPAPALLNVTAVGPNGPGYLTAYPCGPLPTVSTLNYAAWQNVPNLTPLASGSGGRSCVLTSQASHVVIDELGTFVP